MQTHNMGFNPYVLYKMPPSTGILVALPYLVTEVLDLEAAQANRLYGFAEGALAAGGLFGGYGILMKSSITPDRKKQNMQTHNMGFNPYVLYKTLPISWRSIKRGNW